MKQIYVTYLDHLGKYYDRFMQIFESIPDGVQAIIYTRAISGIPVPYSESIRVIEMPSGFFYRSFFLKWQLFLRVKREGRGARVVVQDWFKNFWLVLLLRKISGMEVTYIYSPVISDFGWIHKRWKGMVPYCGLRYDWLRGKSAWLDWWLCKICDRVIVQSEELVGFYRQAYGLNEKDICFSYNHYNDSPSSIEASMLSDASASPPNSSIRLGFVGNFEMHKGAREMVEMARSLPQGFLLRIAGKAKGRANIALFERIRSFENVEVAGQLSREKLEMFYRDIDALLLLSYHEGSPRVVREFLRYGKPIFLYDNPGLDYCKGLPGVYIYPYAAWRDVLLDIATVQYGVLSTRPSPPVLNEMRLKSCLKEIFGV